MDLSEMLLVLKAAKEKAPGIPVMTTMTYEATPKGFFTIMGVTIEKAARTLEDAGVSTIGGCCGTGPAHIRALKNAISPSPEYHK